jgi:translation initiation factor IF-2
MPQTKEVIELIGNEERQGKLNVVVAINKMDKPGVDSVCCIIRAARSFIQRTA